MGTDDVRDAVLDAARAAFHARGYVRTSVRALPPRQGSHLRSSIGTGTPRNRCSPQRCGYRSTLPAPSPSSSLPDSTGWGAAHPATLDLLADEGQPQRLHRAVPGRCLRDQSRKSMQDFIERSIVDRLVRTLGVPDARLRVNLIVSYLLGIASTRYIIRLEPIASMPEDDLVKLVAPTIQNWLDPTKPLKSPKPQAPKSSTKVNVTEPKPGNGG